MLRQRVLTALILGPILLWVVVWAPSSITMVVIASVIILGAWEWAQFFVPATKQIWRWIYLVVIAASMEIAWRIGLRGSGLSNVLSVAMLWWVTAFVWLAFAPVRVNAMLAALAGVLVLAPTWVALTRLHDVPSRGPILVLFLLLLVFAADVGAYFAGRSFGRLKLAPRVSPGKTWEGVIGGFAAAAIVAIVGAYWLSLPLWTFLALCSAVVMVSIVGDLTESMFKRHAGVKDSSNLLPGHGGILDRIDSITAAAPMFALGMMWMGVLS
jgi:phosphatidate cytidylyltransferase